MPFTSKEEGKDEQINFDLPDYTQYIGNHFALLRRDIHPFQRLKPLTTLTFLLLVTFSWGQVAGPEKITLKVTLEYSPVNLEIIKDGEQFPSLEVQEGLKLRVMEHGNYKFMITDPGKLQTWADSVLVQKGQVMELMIILDGPCLYDHPADYIPTCTENHTDNIIPIVYGLIAQSGDTKNEEFLSGGCVVTDCDPRYYCKVHKLRF